MWSVLNVKQDISAIAMLPLRFRDITEEEAEDRDHEGKWNSIFWTYQDPALRNLQQLWLATWDLISQHPAPRGEGSWAPIPTEDLFTVNGCWGMVSERSLRVWLLIDQQYYKGWYLILECVWAVQIIFGGYWIKKKEKWDGGRSGKSWGSQNTYFQFYYYSTTKFYYFTFGFVLQIVRIKKEK